MANLRDREVIDAIGGALSRIKEIRMVSPGREQVDRLTHVGTRLSTLHKTLVDDDFVPEFNSSKRESLKVFTHQEAVDRVLRESKDLNDVASLERFSDAVQGLIDFKQNS